MTRLPDSQSTEEAVRAFMRGRALAIPPGLEEAIRTEVRRAPSRGNRAHSWLSLAAAVTTLLVGAVFVAIVVRGTAVPPDRGAMPAATEIASSVASGTAAATSSPAIAAATEGVPTKPPVDGSLEPISLRNPSAEVADVLRMCWAGDPATQAKIVGMALIPSAREAPDYVSLTGMEPEIQTDSPAWVIDFRGDVGTRVGSLINPICVVVDGETSLFGTGGRKVEGKVVSTPRPDPDPPTRALPAPLRTESSPLPTDRSPEALTSSGPTPPTELPLEAVVEKAGIQLRIDLDRNPMPAGQPTWATTEVRNTGTRDLHWITDGCETHVGVSAELQGVTWDPGTATDGPLAEHRDWFIESANLTEGSIWFSFAKPAHVGMVRGGCGDIAIGHRLSPGDVKRQRLLWDGSAAPRLGPPPSAP
ncbi:MAG: hypothetical protein H0X16_09615, partial [Chloroflexi bacterium]|nr:hypothetical protein [Chloroflexota bacterium]